MSRWHQRFSAARQVHAEKLSTQEKLLTDHVQERFEHQIISFPWHAPTLDDGAVGEIVPYQYDADTLVRQSCDAAKVLGGQRWIKMGVFAQSHTFLKVVKGKLNRRFNQIQDDRMAWKVAFIRLKLAGRAGGAGVFIATDNKVEYFDVKEILCGRSVQQWFDEVYVWRCVTSSWLRFRDFTTSSSSNALTTMQHGHTQALALDVFSGHAIGAYAEAVVRQMLDSNSDVFWLDSVSGKLHGDMENGTIEVQHLFLKHINNKNKTK